MQFPNLSSIMVSLFYYRPRDIVTQSQGQDDETPKTKRICCGGNIHVSCLKNIKEKTPPSYTFKIEKNVNNLSVCFR